METSNPPRNSQGAVGSASQPEGVPRRVLLIAHEEASRSFVREILQTAGYHLDLASDGFDGVAQAADYRYDLIVCDLDMPQLSGIDVACEIRNIERREGNLRSRTPIVAYTADGRAETYAKALDADIDALLEKPVRSHELLENAREAADDRTVVLVVDADADRVRAIEKHCASLSKVRVIVASCSSEACQRLRRERVDLAIVNAVTAGLNGQGAARLLRTVAPLAMPIVALLEGADEAARLRCIAYSFTDCISEPLGRSMVASALQTYGTYGRSTARRSSPRRLATRAWSGSVVATIDEDDDVRALLPQFLNNLARDIEVIRTDLAQGLTESSVRIGHNFKGTGKSYGFPGISSVGARLEDAGYRGDVASAQGCIELLLFELEQGRSKIS